MGYLIVESWFHWFRIVIVLRWVQVDSDEAKGKSLQKKNLEHCPK